LLNLREFLTATICLNNRDQQLRSARELLKCR
jgi:hypothetical protein